MFIVKEKPSAWKTFQGKDTTPNSVDHQHLSNIYWFGIILCDTRHDWALDVISERFNGQLLPYRPHADFKREIGKLDAMGLIQWKDAQIGDVIKEGDIFWHGRKVGNLRIPVRDWN